jgi:adenine deaminase
VHLREGSAARNLSTLIKGVTAAISRRCTFCTDDREPDDITSRGHINGILRQAVADGIDPVLAITMATLNPAECYGLKTKGAIAPGYDADIILVEDLEKFVVKKVITAGHQVAADGEIVAEAFSGAPSQSAPSVHLGPISIESFALRCSSTKVPVIGLIPGNIFTRKVIRDVLLDGNHLFQVANNPGLTKLAVVERHKATGRVGVGILENYGITNGAIATTIAHDAHNIVVAGDNDGDMLAAVQAIEELGGGIVLCREGRVVESLPLPVAGLMCEKSAEEVGTVLQRMISLARDSFSVNVAIQPFMTLSFMSLSVIPELKLTDQGLLDVNTFTLCPY